MTNYKYFCDSVLPEIFNRGSNGPDIPINYESVKSKIRKVVSKLPESELNNAAKYYSLLNSLFLKDENDKIDIYESILLICLFKFPDLHYPLTSTSELKDLFDGDTLVSSPTRLIIENNLNTSAKELNEIFYSEGYLKLVYYYSNDEVKYYYAPTDSGKCYFVNIGKRLFYKNSKFHELIHLYNRFIKLRCPE